MTSERSSLFFFKKKRVVLYRNYSYISDAVFTKLSLWHMHAVACHQSFTFPITCDSEENKSYLLDNLLISRPGAIIFTAKLHYLADLVGWRGAFVLDGIRQVPIYIICTAWSSRKKKNSKPFITLFVSCCSRSKTVFSLKRFLESILWYLFEVVFSVKTKGITHG